MILKMLRYILGYVYVEVSGFAPERFMNLIIRNEIVIWDVEAKTQGYSFYIGRYNLMKIKPYLKKTNMKCIIHKRIGIPFVLKKSKKKFSFFIGFCLAGLLIYSLSLFVWEVQVIGEDKLVKDNLLEHIEEKYVPLGTLKTKVNCSELEESLRKDYKELSWISCELKGTCLTIYLEEGIGSMHGVKDNNMIGDIIASKDGIITKMVTREGTPVCKVGDIVKKGDILISGTVYIYDDNNEVIETSYIAADGDVFANTTNEYYDYIDLNYYEKTYFQKSKRYVSVYIGKYCITPFTPKISKGNYDTFTTIKKAKLFNSFYLPFGYKIIEERPYKLTKKSYSEKEAKKILEQRLSEKIKKLHKKKVEITKNDVKIERNDNKIIAKGKLQLKESIVQFKNGPGKLLQKEKTQ